jgi:hypothetical protein
VHPEAPAAYLIGLGVEVLFGLLKKRPPTTRRLLLGKTAKLTFDTSRAKCVLGWTPEIHWQEGLRRAVAAAGNAEPDQRRSARRPSAVSGEPAR